MVLPYGLVSTLVSDNFKLLRVPLIDLLTPVITGRASAGWVSSAARNSQFSVAEFETGGCSPEVITKPRGLSGKKEF